MKNLLITNILEIKIYDFLLSLYTITFTKVKYFSKAISNHSFSINSFQWTKVLKFITYFNFNVLFIKEFTHILINNNWPVPWTSLIFFKKNKEI